MAVFPQIIQLFKLLMVLEPYIAPPFLAEFEAKVEFVEVMVVAITLYIAPPPPEEPTALFE